MTASLPESPLCGDCGAKMSLRESKYGWFYGCTRFPRCRGTHCVHQDTKLPMGTPADKKTRQARRAAHLAFDTLWKGGPLTRKEAYRWLRKEMDLTEREAHIGNLTLAQCETLVAAVKRVKGDDHG